MLIAAARASRANAAAERRAAHSAAPALLRRFRPFAASRWVKAQSHHTSACTSAIAKLSIFRWETIIESIVRT